MKELLARVRYPREDHNPHESGHIRQPTGYWCDWSGAFYLEVPGIEEWPLTLVRKEGVRYSETPGCCCPAAVVVRGLPAAVRALTGDVEIVDELSDDYEPTPKWSDFTTPIIFGGPS